MSIHKHAFLGKDYVDIADAKISVMTHAFLYGTAVFEGIRGYYDEKKDCVYLLQARPHLKRILNSCKIMRMQPYYNVDEMLNIIKQLVLRNQPKNDFYIRPSWFKSALRIGPSLYSPQAQDDDSFVVTCLDLGDYLDTTKGLSVQVSSWRRLSDNAIPPRAKVNGSYVNTALAKASSQFAGYDDSIFLTEEGNVSEGSAMNLFIVRDGQLITSASTDNILEGITRNFVIKLAKEELNLNVQTRNIDRTELYLAEEAFFAGTGAQIAAIGAIDDYKIGDGSMGAITKQIQSLHHQVTHGQLDKYASEIETISY
jgi:branched-chain amino acid aminotransferase